MPVDGEADDEKRKDDHEESRGAAVPAEVEMAGAGGQQRQDHRKDRARFHAWLTIPSKCGRSLSNVTLRSSGTSRAPAVTLMTFASPPPPPPISIWHCSATPPPPPS